MPVTLDKEAEAAIQKSPEIAAEVSAYAVYLAKIRSRKSSEADSILSEAISLAAQEQSDWEDRSSEMERLLDEIASQAASGK